MADVEAAPGELLETLRKAAAALTGSGVKFALAGGYAAYARGAAPSTHDVDFVLPEEEVDVALAALESVGMRRAEIPEAWLAKVYDDGRTVDLIFRPSGRAVDAALLSRAEEMHVEAVAMPVLTATDMTILRLLAFDEKASDFGGYLPVSRALREQIDWPRVIAETADSPYAYAYLTLLHRLHVMEYGPPYERSDG
ncbi:nucleotidyltransferase [Actinoallomurus soli]|uniref:nucleotidyltransferase n=1 Tax=Actinoallomurus soli TaxID=2952535 RepID=UPI002092E690|nr:nucleotidyltransferase [Actinoallomurus soli]MCO5970783.1 nucleotidyltransferase [Actinoallomurus soli]